jgi:hypothetical protein
VARYPGADSLGISLSTLAFSRGGARILWRGVDASPTSVAMTASDGDLLDALLEEFASLFQEP